MRLYRVEHDYKGESFEMSPRIPDTACSIHENTSISRICAAPTIIGCLTSKEEAMSRINFSESIMYLYSTDVDDPYIPSEEECFDAWITGEMWILHDAKFTLKAPFKFRRMQDLGCTAYSRFSVRLGTKIFGDKYEYPEEVCDRISDKAVYGDMHSFCFIELCTSRYHAAEEAFENCYKHNK